MAGRLAGFRHEFYRCLSARADALFELADALLCGDRPVRTLVELSVAGEHRRCHGSLYAALNHGRIDVDRLRTALATVPVPVPRAADGRIVLAVDGTCWLRPEAHTVPQRVRCHTYGRGKDTHIMVPAGLTRWSPRWRRAAAAGLRRWTSVGSRRATVRAWHRLHPRLTHRTAWTSEHGPLPSIEGTVIGLTVERLPSSVRPP